MQLVAIISLVLVGVCLMCFELEGGFVDVVLRRDFGDVEVDERRRFPVFFDCFFFGGIIDFVVEMREMMRFLTI